MLRMSFVAIATLVGCGSEDQKKTDNDGTDDTDTSTDTDPVYTDRGPDCEEPATDADRRATVLVPEECSTIQYALETVQCTDGYIDVSSEDVITGTSDFSAAGCDSFEGLTISGSGELPSVLDQTTRDEPVMMSVYGSHTVSLNNFFFVGIGRPELSGSETGTTLLELGGGADVTVTDLTFVDAMNGAATYDGTYYESGSRYDTIYGTAVYAGSGADVTMVNTVVNGQVHTDQPMIHAEGASSVLIAGLTVADVDSTTDIMSLDAERFQVYGGTYTNNETLGYVVNLYGGEPYETVGGQQIDLDSRFFSNLVVNNQVGPGGAVKMDACGEATAANNTVMNNSSHTGGMDGVVDLTNTCGKGKTTWTNGLTANHPELAGQEVYIGFDDPDVDVRYSVSYDNGTAPLQQDNGGTNVLADEDPLPNGEELQILDADTCFLDASAYAHEDGNSYLDETGEPGSQFTNPGEEDVSDIGAYGGPYREILIGQEAHVEAYPWFDEDVCAE